ncbi:MAG: S46 family peptidase [Bacteroidia bacterium]
MLRNCLMAVAMITLLTTQSFAQTDKESDEGMWLPFKVQQNIEAMQTKGFELEASGLYNEDGPALSDAVVRLGRGFCTGEMISSQGLMLTNHHCGRGFVTDLSTDDDNILENGFWPKSFDEERPCPGFTVSYLVGSKDVTAQVVGAGANQAKVVAEIEEEASQGGKYDATVRAMYAGNEFYLFVYKTYRDVRLAGVPPLSIGEYGGDTDNWMWPRHTGDFTLFRIYAGPDNEPADYSANNQPYKPSKFFPVSIKGIEENDYAMVMGYPGSTSRYLSSSDIELALRQNNPDIVKLRTARLDLLRAEMDKSPSKRLKLFKTFKGISNYWKYFIGQTKSLNDYDVVGIKKQEEAAFQQWADANPSRREKYGNVLSELKTINESATDVLRFFTYYQEGMRPAKGFSVGARMLTALGKTGDDDGYKSEEMTEMIDKMKGQVDDKFADYYADLDQETFKQMIQFFYTDVSEKYRPSIFADILTHKAGKKATTPAAKIAAWADWAYETSAATSPERMKELLGNFKQKSLEKDPMYQFRTSIAATYNENVDEIRAYYGSLGPLQKAYIAGIREMKPERQFYPDANSTMRFTFGKVASYYPRDGVWYNFQTTAEGIIEKEDPENREFRVPAKFKTLYENKDYGDYANKDGELPVCFLSTTDITGGNSGSPILNANGELIGCAFDGNWEAMASDIYVFPEVTRTISVDIRYVLFTIEKMGGAKRLIEEMDIRK